MGNSLEPQSLVVRVAVNRRHWSRSSRPVVTCKRQTAQVKPQDTYTENINHYVSVVKQSVSVRPFESSE